MGVAIDETGNRYGKLTVLGRSGKKTRDPIWVCECNCGNFSRPSIYSLRSGHTKSCGCNRAEAAAIAEGLAAFNLVFRNYKNGAKNRGLVFEINKEEFRKISSMDCFYCGSKPATVKETNNGSYTYNGMDRKDNSIGYTKDNIVPCCETCNRAKLQMTVKEFLGWVERVSEHQYKI